MEKRSESSEDSTADETVWTEVERQKINNRKKKMLKEKKKLKERMTLKKAAGMVGIGPIEDASIDYFEEARNDK